MRVAYALSRLTQHGDIDFVVPVEDAANFPMQPLELPLNSREIEVDSVNILRLVIPVLIKRWNTRTAKVDVKRRSYQGYCIQTPPDKRQAS